MTSKKNEKSEKKNNAKKSFAMIMNGEFLTKDFVLNNLPFIFFIIFFVLFSFNNNTRPRVGVPNGQPPEARSSSVLHRKQHPKRYMFFVFLGIVW